MVTVNVLLSGRLKLDGYGKGYPLSQDGTYRLAMREGSTVQDIIQGMGVPADKVTLTMLNAHKCPVGASLKADDRVILIPKDVAAMWRAFGVQNMGAESVFDF